MELGGTTIARMLSGGSIPEFPSFLFKGTSKFNGEKGKGDQPDSQATSETGSSTTEPGENSSSKNRKYLRSKMKGRWQEDMGFLKKHFPSNKQLKAAATTIMSTHYIKKVKRWRRIPEVPKDSRDIVGHIHILLNSILSKSNISSLRRAFLRPDTEKMKASRTPLQPPSLLLCGVGRNIVSNLDGMPIPEYRAGIVPIQVMLEAEYKPSKRHLSAAHANEIFRAQDNRRYLFAAIITERYLRVFMMDASGSVMAPRLDYHAKPAQFVSIVAGMASLDEVRAGFDPSISLDTKMRPTIQLKITSGADKGKELSFLIKERLFKASKFIGRSTACWLVASMVSKPKLYVIKDAWMGYSQSQNEMEGSLISYAASKGVTRGLVRIQHQSIISVPRRSGDTIIKNRRIRSGVFTTEYGMVQDRIHTRIVMETCGKPIWHFSNRRELLVAFHDAVDAHRRLLQVAGVLHRDISMNNILINIDPNAEEGDRGLLIDLDFAVRIEKQPLEPIHVGTARFMSYHITQRRRRHSYLDDLESFYYVLCWLICGYDGPRDSRIKTPDALKALEAKDEGNSKLLHIQKSFDLPVQPWFGPSIQELAVQLHDFFQRRLDSSSVPLSPEQDADRDYAEYLGYIKAAIGKLEPEDEMIAGNEGSAKVKLAAIENQASQFFRKRKLGEMGDVEEEDGTLKKRRCSVWSQVRGNVEPPRRSKRLSRRAQAGTKRLRKRRK